MGPWRTYFFTSVSEHKIDACVVHITNDQLDNKYQYY